MMFGKVPVAPGPEGAQLPSLPIPACAACGTTGSATRVPMRISDDEAIVICLDGHECGVRYRAGMSPESYAAGLRGELLAVAP